ncbi:acyltransferase [Synechococcus sp. FGCU-3]|nr:acyltransferase [Synechococcus sp. FGCU3]
MKLVSRNHFLDALRGIAALLVLATHLQSSLVGFYPGGWLAGRPVAIAVLEHGAIGVDVFFLISGFIVFLAARRVIYAGRGVRLFLLKRFLRIYLPYWPIALVLGASYALLPGLSAASVPIQVNWLKSLTLIPGGGDYSLSVAWTLTFEVFFYLLLGVALALRSPHWRLCCIAAPSLLAVVLPLMSGVSVGFVQATSLATLLASPYQLEFLLGCAVAVLAAQRWPQLAVLRSYASLQLALLLIALVLLLLPLPATLAYRLGLLLVLSALILLSSVRDFDQLPGVRTMASVGVISYSLYLLHNPIQSLAIRLAVRLALPEVSAALLLVLLPLLAALFYFRTVEAWSLHLMQRAAQRLQPV